MEYNQPSEIVKDVSFGDNAKNKVIAGVEKLAKAVLNFFPDSTFSNTGANIGPHPFKSGVDSIVFSHSSYLLKSFYYFWAFYRF